MLGLWASLCGSDFSLSCICLALRYFNQAYIIGGGRLEFPPSFFPSAQNALGDIVDNQMFISPLYGSWMKMTCIQHIQHNYSD